MKGKVGPFLYIEFIITTGGWVGWKGMIILLEGRRRDGFFCFVSAGEMLLIRKENFSGKFTSIDS